MDEEAEMAREGLWPRVRGRLFHLFFLVRRPMTLGVRAVIHDRDANSIFLIRHTYVPGWHLPGGGVEVGETMLDALRRELAEEANVELLSEPQLRSIHFNRGASRRDHVAFYLVTDYRQSAPKTRDLEVAEAGFFPMDGLPRGTTSATRRRLVELFDGIPPTADW